MRIRAGVLAVVLCASRVGGRGSRRRTPRPRPRPRPVAVPEGAHGRDRRAPALLGRRVSRPLRRPLPADSRAPASSRRGPASQIPRARVTAAAYADVRGNAFYCLQSNFIAYDDVALMPRPRGRRSARSRSRSCSRTSGATRIQDRAGNGDEQTVYLEQQADCFAGAFLSHVAEDGNVARARSRAISKRRSGRCCSCRDAPGQSAADPSAHGSAFDRIERVPGRLRVGRRAVRRRTSRTPPVLVEVPFSSARGGAERGRDRRRGRDPAHRRPAERLLLPGRAELRAARRPKTSSPSTARSPARCRSAAAPRSPHAGREPGLLLPRRRLHRRSTSRSSKTSTTRSATSASRP